MQYNLKEKGGYAYFRALSIKYIQIVFIDATADSFDARFARDTGSYYKILKTTVYFVL